MANTIPRILISGNFAPKDFERCWLDWLQVHCYPVQKFDPVAIIKEHVPSILLQRILWRSFHPLLASLISRQFLKTAYSFRPDLILVVSGNFINSAVLKTIRQKIGATLFHYYGEDFFNPLNTKNTLKRSIYSYDHLFTTKTFNVPELAKLGITNITYIPCGYIPSSHFPLKINRADLQQYGSDLAFVGTWEAERASILAQLTEFNLRIWGGYWHKAKNTVGLQKAIQNRLVYCDEMSRVFNASRINLAFLRKANRDRHDQRTFEIPACGGFELSERTDEVLSFFDEGHEIECFDSVDELKDKAHYYLNNEAQREQIAAAGLARVQHSAYSYTDHIQTILKHFPLI